MASVNGNEVKASPETEHPRKAFGWAARDSSGVLSPFSFSRRNNRDDDVTIKILYCGICHSDLHYIKNEWSNTIYPVVPGALSMIQLQEFEACIVLYSMLAGGFYPSRCTRFRIFGNLLLYLLPKHFRFNFFSRDLLFFFLGYNERPTFAPPHMLLNLLLRSTQFLCDLSAWEPYHNHCIWMDTKRLLNACCRKQNLEH